MKRSISILFLFALIIGTGFWWYDDRLERSQDKAIVDAAHYYRVPFVLVKAVVWRESRFHPESTGRAGERGLMQIMPTTASDWAKAAKVAHFQGDHLFDPRTNLYVGTWYLQKLLQRYARTDDPVAYALADYNAGRSNVLRWNKGVASTNSALFLEQITFPGTRNYVISIMDRAHRYTEPPASDN